MVLSEGHAVAADNYPEGGGERGADPAADPRRRGAGQLFPGLARRRRLDAKERDPQRRGRAGTMDIGLTQLPSFNARSCLNAGTYGTMGSASARPSPPAS